MRLKVLQNLLASSKFVAKKTQTLGLCLKLTTKGCCNTANEPPIDIENVQTMQDIREKLHGMMGMSGKYEHKDRSHLFEYLPQNRDELPPRTMKDSFDRALVPLSSNITLQNKYTTTRRGLRVGRLLEDMDLFAVWIVFKHIYSPKIPLDVPHPYVAVTLLVDEVIIHPKRYPDKDIILSGHVSYAGKTSMEISLWLDQLQDNKLQRVTNANFVFVARDPLNKSSVLVNELDPSGDDEKELLKLSLERNEFRKKTRQDSILNKMPNPEEQELIYKTFLKTVDEKEPMLGNKVLPQESVWMQDTKIESNILCHPEDRNLHSTVFGGYLMRMATELAYLVASVHSKSQVKVKAINSIAFRNPVPIGSRLRLIGKICYTIDKAMVIEVIAKVDKVETKSSITTNSFYFVYKSPNDVKHVLPQSYHDAMLYIDGRRRFLDISHKITNGES